MGRSPASLDGLQYTEIAREIRERVQKKRAQNKKPVPKESSGFFVGQHVYLLLERPKFFKSFDRGATAIYSIRRVDRRKRPYLYYLKDLKGDNLSESHYR